MSAEPGCVSAEPGCVSAEPGCVSAEPSVATNLVLTIVIAIATAQYICSCVAGHVQPMFNCLK